MNRKPRLMTVDGRAIHLTWHAVERYAERASQWPDEPYRTRGQLLRLVADFGHVLQERPAWVNERPAERSQKSFCLSRGRLRKRRTAVVPCGAP